MDAWDFYKPRSGTEYPLVDGQLSQEIYLKCVDTCYSRYKYVLEI